MSFGSTRLRYTLTRMEPLELMRHSKVSPQDVVLFVHIEAYLFDSGFKGIPSAIRYFYRFLLLTDMC
jgi:hypothetical protein